MKKIFERGGLFVDADERERLLVRNEENCRLKMGELNLWLECFEECPLMYETLKDLCSVAKLYTPNLWVLHMFAMIAVLVGGKYNGFLGGNLNVYVVGIADTGKGKEGSRRYFESIFDLIGVGDCITGINLKSNIGFEDDLKDNANALYMIDEIGMFLTNLARNQSHSHLQGLISLTTSAWSSQNLIFARSKGVGRIKKKNINVNIYGVTTKESLIGGITPESLLTGQMNRYICGVENNIGVNVDLKKNGDSVSGKVVDLWRELLTAQKESPDMKLDIAFSESDIVFLNEERAVNASYIDDRHKKGDMSAGAYVRTVENAIRLACLYAIARNPVKPVFDLYIYKVLFETVKTGVDEMHELATLNFSKRLHRSKDIRDGIIGESVLTCLKEFFEKVEPYHARKGIAVGKLKQLLASAPRKFRYDEIIFTNDAIFAAMRIICENNGLERARLRGRTIYLDIPLPY